MEHCARLFVQAETDTLFIQPPRMCLQKSDSFINIPHRISEEMFVETADKETGFKISSLKE